MIEAVIIDFDDTLCLTEEACFNLENETLRRLGREPMSRGIHRETWGQPLYDAIQLRSPGVDADEFWKLMPTVHEEFVGNGQIDIVTEENLQTLDKLAQLGKKLMILTSRTEVEMKHLLVPTHHLASRIANFYYKDNMAYHKPDPRAFEVIEREHGLLPAQCVYVGDSPGDAAAAKGAKLHFVASLEGGLRSRDDFDAYPVDAFINKFADLYDEVVLLEAA
jgi:phosphoglycolate phosphatase